MTFFVLFLIFQLIHIFFLLRIKRKIIDYQMTSPKPKTKKQLSSLLTLDAIAFITAMVFLYGSTISEPDNASLAEINLINLLFVLLVLIFNTFLLLRLRQIPKTLHPTFQRPTSSSYL